MQWSFEANNGNVLERQYDYERFFNVFIWIEPTQRPSFDTIVDMLSPDAIVKNVHKSEVKKGIDTAEDLELLKQRILAKNKLLESSDQ